MQHNEPRDLSRGLLTFTEGAISIHFLSRNETVLDDESRQSAMKLAVRPKHNRIELMNDLEHSLSSMVVMNQEPFAGTCLTVKVCLQAEEHSSFVGSDKAVQYLEKLMLHVMRTVPFSRLDRRQICLVMKS